MKVAWFVFLTAMTVASPALAQSDAIRSLARSPNGSDDWKACGNLQLPIEERMGFCRSAIKSGHFDEYETLARLQRVAGRYDDALASIAKLTDRLPDIPTDRPSLQSDDWVPLLMARGEVYAQMGRFDDAKKDADEIGHINPDEAENRNQQCWIRAIAGKELDQALDACNRSLERKPRVARTRDSRGLIYFKLGKFQEALADYDTALQRDSTLDSSRFARGVVKLRLGDADGGNKDIADAKARNAGIAQELAGYGVAP